MQSLHLLCSCKRILNLFSKDIILILLLKKYKSKFLKLWFTKCKYFFYLLVSNIIEIMISSSDCNNLFIWLMNNFHTLINNVVVVGIGNQLIMIYVHHDMKLYSLIWCSTNPKKLPLTPFYNLCLVNYCTWYLSYKILRFFFLITIIWADR